MYLNVRRCMHLENLIEMYSKVNSLHYIHNNFIKLKIYVLKSDMLTLTSIFL